MKGKRERKNGKKEGEGKGREGGTRGGMDVDAVPPPAQAPLKAKTHCKKLSGGRGGKGNESLALGHAWQGSPKGQKTRTQDEKSISIVNRQSSVIKRIKKKEKSTKEPATPKNQPRISETRPKRKEKEKEKEKEKKGGWMMANGDQVIGQPASQPASQTQAQAPSTDDHSLVQ